MANKFLYHILFLAIILCTCQSALAMNSNDIANITANIRLSITNVECINTHYRNAQIAWNTNGLATTEIYYDIVPHEQYTDYSFSKSGNPDKRELYHKITIAPLEEGTTYHFRAVSMMGGQLPAVSEDCTFTTPERWWKKDWMESLLNWFLG